MLPVPAFQVKQPHSCPEGASPVCDALIIHIITETKDVVLRSRSFLKETDNIRGLFLVHSMPTNTIDRKKHVPYVAPELRVCLRPPCGEVLHKPNSSEK